MAWYGVFFFLVPKITSVIKTGAQRDTHYIVDEPQKHYAKWEKPDAKGYVLHDFIYMKCLDETSL